MHLRRNSKGRRKRFDVEKYGLIVEPSEAGTAWGIYPPGTTWVDIYAGVRPVGWVPAGPGRPNQADYDQAAERAGLLSISKPKTLGRRLMGEDFLKAEAALVAAHKATSDRVVADAIERARKELATAAAGRLQRH
jgi:hypothetical protein